MEMKFENGKNGKIAHLSPEVLLSGLDDFLDLIGNASYNDAFKIIVSKEQVVEQFFDLKTKVAGDILQKFSTYNMRMAIVGDFKEISSKSLRDFIRESNRVGRILFVESKEEAVKVFEK